MINNIIFGSPTLDDAKQTLDLMIRCDIAYSGEADSELEDLVNDWNEIDLGQDAWLVLASDQNVIGYASVMQWNADLRYDIYVEPTLDDDTSSVNYYPVVKQEERNWQKRKIPW